MKTINIIGFGAVVQSFLQTYKKDFPDLTFKIYCRSFVENHTDSNIIFHHINTYTPNHHPTFFCCSINEAEALQNMKEQSSRLSVAIPNLQLVQHFLQAGFFNTGLHFILTNPCELIAEYIIHHSQNKNIYALGLSVDYARYKKILAELDIDKKFNVVGNHWNSPLINFIDDFSDNNITFLKNLMANLKNKIKTEFNGYKPPVASGARALHDAIFSLSHGDEIAVSGFNGEHGVVSSGTLNTVTGEFSQSEMNRVVSELLVEAINFHKETYLKLTQEIT